MPLARRPITIKDVAKAAGVGISTVSRALNDSGSVHPETRERIQAAVAELGFRPNAVAKSMVTRSSCTLGLIVPDLRNPYFPALARGVEDTAAELGYTVMVGNSDNDAAREWNYVCTLIDKQVDGVILTGTATAESVLRELAKHGIHVISPDRAFEGLADIVWTNQVEGARMATEHLIGLGHRRIAFIGGPPDARVSFERLEGYQVAMADRGLTVEPRLLRTGNFRPEGGAREAAALWDAADRPTAIYAINDLTAIGVMSALAARGARFPEDVAVVGHGDSFFAPHTSPPLSSVAEPLHEWGEAAVTMLIDRVSGRFTGPSRVRVLRSHLQIRASTTGGPQGA